MNIKNRRNNIDLDEIVDEFTPYVKKVIDNMVGNNLSYEDKEEILTDTFFVLWKNRNNKINYLDSYIAGIAKNLVKEKFKKFNITYNIERCNLFYIQLHFTIVNNFHKDNIGKNRRIIYEYTWNCNATD